MNSHYDNILCEVGFSEWYWRILSYFGVILINFGFVFLIGILADRLDESGVGAGVFAVLVLAGILSYKLINNIQNYFCNIELNDGIMKSLSYNKIAHKSYFGKGIMDYVWVVLGDLVFVGLSCLLVYGVYHLVIYIKRNA